MGARSGVTKLNVVIDERWELHADKPGLTHPSGTPSTPWGHAQKTKWREAAALRSAQRPARRVAPESNPMGSYPRPYHSGGREMPNFHLPEPSCATSGSSKWSSTQGGHSAATQATCKPETPSVDDRALPFSTLPTRDPGQQAIQ